MNALYQTWKKLINHETERQKNVQKGDRWRPLLHIAPPFGWMNDPNGLCQFQGVYHAFYQFAPFDADGGLKFWGHYTSRDLLHWEFQGVPLMPDQPYDCHGVYSGSALLENNNMYVYYTGNVKQLGEYDYIVKGRESNTVLAVSQDGFHFDSKELIMTNQDYPNDLTCHVRDPKVWKQDGIYYMVQGARTKDNKGIVLIFTSENGRDFSYRNRLQTEDALGYMWECPDLFELDGKMVLCISPQGMKAAGLQYQNVYQSLVGFLDGDFLENAVPGHFQELDGGFDFYAPQSFLAEDGRRIQIAWMGMADARNLYTNRTVEDGWQNVLTFPRELSVRDNRVYQKPAKELSSWWNQKESFSGYFHREIETCCELNWKLDGGNLKVTLSGGLVLRYDDSEKIFWMEFIDPILGAGRTKRGRKLDKLMDMQVFLDVSCVEIFLNGGADVFSTRFYPEKFQYYVESEDFRGTGYYQYHKTPSFSETRDE